MIRPLVAAFVLSVAAHGAAAVHTADIVVYGGTSSGIAAAVQAARLGKSVLLISPERRLGGMTTNGLGATDSGDKRVIGGLALEFYTRLKDHYDDPAAWKFVRREDYADWRPKVPTIWRFEPKVAQELFETMLREAQVEVLREQRLVRNNKQGVVKDGQRIIAIRFEPSGDECRGKVFIDATYEGDLMAEAGVSYRVGRESNATYGETLNGVQPALNVKNHRFEVPVDPYVEPGNPDSGLVWGVHDGPRGATGEGDHRIQAYCFRMCMSNVPENRVPFEKPADYDESQYELLFRNFEAGDMRVPFHPVMMPNGKTDTNNMGAFSTDNIGQNYDYPEATYDQREQIERTHLRYQQGLMWSLANHPRVPEKVRKHMEQWGLAADEFTDNGHWPTEMYIREARRMIGEYVVTESDVRSKRVVGDSVGMGSYNMDSHNCQRFVDENGRVQNEGDVQVSPGGAYVISYRSLVPKREEATNLLVPVCLSASHIAYGSIRMEPVFMILGQSAATAASQAIDSDVVVQDVDYANLRRRLLADGQILEKP